MAHDLIGSTCFTTSGKSIVDAAYYKGLKGEDYFEWNYQLFGERKHLEVKKHEGVSLCHIAASRLDLVACTFLTAVGGNSSETGYRNMVEYVQRYLGDYHERTITKKNAKIVKVVFHTLRTAQPLPSILPQAFYILHHEGYDVMYHPGSKCPIVREVLHEKTLVRNVDNRKHTGYRQNQLIPKTNRAAIEDFKTKGIVLGHAKPRADALISDQALYDVGYLTNIMAQDHTLNNGLWKKLEREIRNLTQQHLCLHVYTGGIFTSAFDIKGPKTITYRVIGLNEVHVPTHLFKVVYVFDYGTGWSSFACLIPNIPLPYNTDLTPYYVSVQRIQELTGVDFLGIRPR